jgi:hypothetical protein
MRISLEIKLCRVRNFLHIYLERARDLAKAGRKDEARDWLRCFSNMGLLDLLSDENVGVLSDEENKYFRQNLLELQNECHPLDAPNYLTDLQAIRGHLESISTHLGVETVSALKVAVI